MKPLLLAFIVTSQNKKKILAKERELKNLIKTLEHLKHFLKFKFVFEKLFIIRYKKIESVNV